MNGFEPPIPAAARLMPCPSCDYNLRGRRVGEQCPECGWLIDAPGPRWWTPECLRRLRLMPRVAMVAAMLALGAPSITVLAVVSTHIARAAEIALTAFLILVPLQALVQGIAVWRMAMPELGVGRVRRLRIATVVRAIAVGLMSAAVWLGARTDGFQGWEKLGLTLYFTLPLVSLAADFVVLRELETLRRESGVLLSGRMAVLPLLGRWMLVPIYFLGLLPLVGWLLGFCGWMIALSIGFAQVEAVAEASRKELPERWG